MKPIGAYALALDYKLINYSSQILDSPYYSVEDKKVLKDEYIGKMSPYLRGSPVPQRCLARLAHQLRRRRRSGQPDACL